MTDSQESATLVAEIPEDAATGDIARIYEEMRTYCAVPYVSTLQRHVATMPGCLEWMWAALRPAFQSGDIPETAWRLAGTVEVAPLPPLSDSALRVFGVDEPAAETIRSICELFVRVSPINLLFAACVRRLLEGETGQGQNTPPADWTPPAPVPPLPPMVDPAALAPDHATVLLQLGDAAPGGAIVVPGLYRFLARWPGYLAHIATELGPRFQDPATRKACDAIARRITDAAPEILSRLPPLSGGPPPPDPAQTKAILAALDHYKGTSPEMVIFGTLLRDALPGE
jgi:hypothetical protein